MAGGVTGNIVSGWQGDRRGGKLVLGLSQFALVLTAVVAILAHGPVACWTGFFGMGFVFAARQVGGSTLLLEIAPAERRATALAVASLVQVGSLLVCSGLSALFWQLGGMLPVGLAAATAAAMTLLSLVRLQEPRRLDAAPELA
jgi:MFS family permease